MTSCIKAYYITPELIETDNPYLFTLDIKNNNFEELINELIKNSNELLLTISSLKSSDYEYEIVKLSNHEI